VIGYVCSVTFQPTPIRAGRGTYSSPEAPYWVARLGRWTTSSEASVEDAIDKMRGIVGERAALIYARTCPL
jgi:hypothetical protein